MAACRRRASSIHATNPARATVAPAARGAHGDGDHGTTRALPQSGRACRGIPCSVIHACRAAVAGVSAGSSRRSGCAWAPYSSMFRVCRSKSGSRAKFAWRGGIVREASARRRRLPRCKSGASSAPDGFMSQHRARRGLRAMAQAPREGNTGAAAGALGPV